MAEYKTLVKKIPISPDKKTKQKDYLKKGQLPIVDQGQSLVGGYTDDVSMSVNCDLPVIVFGDHTRAVKYITFPFGAGADGIKVLKPNDSILPLFLYYGTQYIVAKMPDRGYARHYQYVEKEELAVPPLQEQERIVARIEELFSQLDAGVETLKKTKAQLAVYRQAVLKEAFDGEFIKNSKRDYKVMKVEEFANVDTGATPLTSKKEYYGGTIAWVASGKINDENIYSPTDYITDLAIRETNCKVFPVGTLLVAMYGEGKTRGKCAELKIPAATNQALAAITLKDNSQVDKNFLKWFFTYNYQNIRRKASGGVQPNLNLRIIKSIFVKIFCLEAQKETVEKIEARLSICEEIEKTLDTALEQAEVMRQSILKKAFSED